MQLNQQSRNPALPLDIKHAVRLRALNGDAGRVQFFLGARERGARAFTKTARPIAPCAANFP
jgi:hypothetical protein